MYNNRKQTVHYIIIQKKKKNVNFIWKRIVDKICV